MGAGKVSGGRGDAAIVVHERCVRWCGGVRRGVEGCGRACGSVKGELSVIDVGPGAATMLVAITLLCRRAGGERSCTRNHI